MTFDGFTSRWTTPRACASARASAIWMAISSTRDSAGRSRAAIADSVSPVTYSMAMKLRAPVLHLRLVDLVDHRDAGVVEPGGQPRLAHQPRAAGRVLGPAVPQHLEGDAAVQPRVLGEVDVAHPASAEAVEDPVVGRRLADHEAAARASSASAMRSAAPGAHGEEQRRLDQLELHQARAAVVVAGEVDARVQRALGAGEAKDARRRVALVVRRLDRRRPPGRRGGRPGSASACGRRGRTGRRCGRDSARRAPPPTAK